jgi:transcriptional regulator with XRE-family HTH domain
MAILTERAIKMNKEIGLVLKLARTARGLNQQQLAEVSGVSQSLITKIENGHVKNPRPFIRISLARALKLPPEIFVSADEIENEKKRETLVSMLTRCGVWQEAASLIVDAIRDRSRDKVIRALSQNRKKSK